MLWRESKRVYFLLQYKMLKSVCLSSLFSTLLATRNAFGAITVLFYSDFYLSLSRPFNIIFVDCKWLKHQVSRRGLVTALVASANTASSRDFFSFV